jgi:hypothetical protein
LWRRAGVEVLLAGPDGSEVDALSLPASAAWLLLERPRTLAELTDGLASRFAADRDEIADRVARLVDELEGRGWLARVPSHA